MSPNPDNKSLVGLHPFETRSNTPKEDSLTLEPTDEDTKWHRRDALSCIWKNAPIAHSCRRVVGGADAGGCLGVLL